MKKGLLLFAAAAMAWMTGKVDASATPSPTLVQGNSPTPPTMAPTFGFPTETGGQTVRWDQPSITQYNITDINSGNVSSININLMVSLNNGLMSTPFEISFYDKDGQNGLGIDASADTPRLTIDLEAGTKVGITVTGPYTAALDIRNQHGDTIEGSNMELSFKSSVQGDPQFTGEANVEIINGQVKALIKAPAHQRNVTGDGVPRTEETPKSSSDSASIGGGVGGTVAGLATLYATLKYRDKISGAMQSCQVMLKPKTSNVTELSSRHSPDI